LISPQELRRQLSGAGVHRGAHGGRIAWPFGIAAYRVMFVSANRSRCHSDLVWQFGGKCPGYELHHGRSPRHRTKNIDASNTTSAAVEDFHRDATCYFTATADNIASLEVSPHHQNISRSFASKMIATRSINASITATYSHA
jgi:hypothetical protein